MLPIYYIISASLQVIRPLVEATRCRVVLPAYQDLSRNARIQLPLVLLDLVSLWRLLWALVVLPGLVRHLLLCLRPTVLRQTIVSSTKEPVPFDCLVVQLLPHVHICSLTLWVILLVLVLLCNSNWLVLLVRASLRTIRWLHIEIGGSLRKVGISSGHVRLPGSYFILTSVGYLHSIERIFRERPLVHD